VSGQLVVSGVHVSLGYLHNNNNNNSNNNFIQHEGKLLFFTGDIAKRNVDGSFTWIGRTDNQTKIHGTRVELEEVEAHISTALDNIPTMVVSIPHALIDDNFLLAVIESSQSQQSSEDLLSILRSTLPAVYVPTVIISLDSFPLTSSGKINRIQIRKMVAEIIATAETPNSTIVEHNIMRNIDLYKDGSVNRGVIEVKVLNVYRSVLGLSSSKEVGVNVSFYELGGNSMTAIEVLWQLKQSLGVTLALKLLLSPMQLVIDELICLIHPVYCSREPVDQGSRDVKAKRKFKALELEVEPTPRWNEFTEILWSGRQGTGTRSHTTDDNLSSEHTVSSGSMHVHWKRQLLKCIDASPVYVQAVKGSRVKEESVVIGSHGGDICCIAVDDGSLRWQVDFEMHIEASVCVNPSLGLVYIAGYEANDVDGDMRPRRDDGMGVVYALTLSDGMIHS
jgi:hypothetical protein